MTFARVAWNYVRARLHRPRCYPCGQCGYRYQCGDPQGSECHS